jgi:hypothetical protein
MHPYVFSWGGANAQRQLEFRRTMLKTVHAFCNATSVQGEQKTSPSIMFSLRGPLLPHAGVRSPPNTVSFEKKEDTDLI